MTKDQYLQTTVDKVCDQDTGIRETQDVRSILQISMSTVPSDDFPTVLNPTTGAQVFVIAKKDVNVTFKVDLTVQLILSERL